MSKPSEAPLTRAELARLMQAFGDLFSRTDEHPEIDLSALAQRLGGTPVDVANGFMALGTPPKPPARPAVRLGSARERRLAARVDASVYFIQAAAGGDIKIGMARDVRSRLRGLQTGASVELTLLGTMSGGEPRERELHTRFVAHRVRGEWFRPAPELLDFIAKEATKP